MLTYAGRRIHYQTELTKVATTQFCEGEGGVREPVKMLSICSLTRPQPDPKIVSTYVSTFPSDYIYACKFLNIRRTVDDYSTHTVHTGRMSQVGCPQLNSAYYRKSANLRTFSKCGNLRVFPYKYSK
jgi:hypothetical protein